MGAQLAKVKAGNLLVELLWQQVHLVLVLGLGLVLAGLVVGLAQLQLRERLVGERVGHHERRVAGSATQVAKAALSKQNHAMAVREHVLVALRLDVHASGSLLEQLHLDLVVEVANVAYDGVILHLAHVLERDDVLVAGSGDEHVRRGNDVLHRHDLVAAHASLQRADGVDLGDVNDGSLRLHRLGRTLAHVAETADDNLLAGEHHIRRTHNAVWQRVAAAVHVVKLGLRDAIVHIDSREKQLALVGHRDETVDARRRLLRDADHARHHLGEALRILLDGTLDGRQHALELGVVGTRRVRERTVLGEGFLELLALVEEQRRIATVINDLVRPLAIWPGERLVGAPPVFLEGLALPREDVGGASAHAARGGVVLRREDVARAPAHVCS
mmetsp:Transcript_31344/g.72943  ORF Transcript_31344/g.72943 Transcript_31344/m.72943 type:complete len:387 (-) Transcript_31344:305-1465(-)